MNPKLQALAALPLLCLALTGCALLGSDRPKPASPEGPPDRAFFFFSVGEPPPEPTETIGGRARVLDGDLIQIDDTLVRLAGIDAPEPDQLCRRASGLPYRCGEDMAALLEQRLQRDRVVCDIARLDGDAERAVGFCRHFGTDINDWMVRQGYAVADNAHSPYVEAEREASREGRGLWQGVFERPADWRERRR